MHTHRFTLPPIALRLVLMLFVAATLAATGLTGCKTTFLADRAVVIYDRSRMDDAQKVAQLLNGQGVRVELQVRGPIPLSGSRVSVYDVGRNRDRPQAVRELLSVVGDFEIIEYWHPDPAKDIVVWLETPQLEGMPGTEDLPETVPTPDAR